jgi:hypothetical protein
VSFPSIVITLCGGQAPGQGYRIEDAMSHDKTRAAARTRMAETGEPYAAARRTVIGEYQAPRGQSLPGPHPGYLITLVGAGSGAGAGVPGAAVRDAMSGRVVDRLPGRMDVYSAVAGTGGGRVFFLARRFGRERMADSDPAAGQMPPGGAVCVQIDDGGKVADLSAVPGVPEPARLGPIHLAASADGGRLAYPVRRDRGGPPAANAPPSEISIVAVATGERTVWQAESDGDISDVSLSADGRRLAYSWHGAGEGNGIRVTDLPDTAPGGVVTTPSRLVIPEQNSLGNLGQAVVSSDGARLYVTAARYGAGGQPVTRLAEISVADGQVRRIAYERRGADYGNVIFGWGPLVIDSSGQHALIAYGGNLGRIELSTGHFTELPMDENGAFDIAW